MDSLRKLRVILWKNLLIRKRHKFLTLVEILIPIVLFLFVSYARSRIPDFSKHYVNESTVLESTPASDIATRLNIRDMKVLYAPKTDFTKNLLRQVQLKLNLYNEGVQGFRNEHDLMAHYDKHGGEEVTAAILFSNVNNSVPTILVYDIRLYEEYVFWNTHQLFLQIREYVPGIGSETYKDKGFLPLQMALDTTFFELVSKNAPNLTLAFQEFPYPPYTMDSGLHAMFIHALPILTLFSFLFMWPSILKRIIEEKSSGIKELMKLNGLEPWMMWASWFIYGFALNIISAVAIVLFLKLKLWHDFYPAVQFCNGVILGVYLLLYCSASISFCFLFSIPFKRPNLAMIIGILFWIIGYLLYSNIAGKTDVLTWSTKIPSLLFPNIALHYGYQAISMFELREIHLGFANLFESPTGSSNDISMGNILLMLLFDTVFYFILSIYLDNLYPGPYGISRKWTYPLQVFHQLRRRNSVTQDTADELSLAQKPNVKIKIRHLKKSYGNKTVVNGLDMDIYEGQITGLLGHNGAGKTTTISILTGMVEATSGKVFIHRGDENDYVDLKENFRSIRHMLSVCPQHNLLFPDLTVLEHLKFFGMLRGSLSSDASKQALDLLGNKLDLIHKKDKSVHTLSGGMKRKLALGMALMGNPEILILDEPTAGVDIEGRRELWDLILPYKKEKTIIITTHFMEEADHLADRIAIMDHGNLVCYETPMKLKLDVGYYLIVNRALVDEPNINEEVKELTEKIKHIMRDYEVECSSLGDAFKFADEIEELAVKIRGVVKDWKLEGCTKDASRFASELEDVAVQIRANSKSAHEVEGLIERIKCAMKGYDGASDAPRVKEIIMNIMKVYDVKHKFTYTYRLPSDEKSKITRLLCMIEDESAKVRELYGHRGVFSFKLCHTTLEDVFLNVGNKAAASQADNKSNDLFNSTVSPGTTTWHKFETLISKRLLFMQKKKLLFLAMVFISTLIIALVFNLGGSGSTDTSQDGPTLNLDLSVYGETGVYYSSTSGKTDQYYEGLIKRQHSIPMKVDSVQDAIIEKGIENIAYYKQRMIVGAKFTGHHDSRTEHVDVMYSNNALHGAPISFNLVMNTMLKTYAGEDHSIVASNTPLHSVDNKRAWLEQTGITNLVMWFILFPLAPLFIISYIISFTHAEESSNIRRLQHICGVSPRLYWITNLIWDVLYYLSVMVMSLFVLYVLTVALSFFGIELFGNYLLFGAQEFGMLALILVVYACSIPWAYWTSYVHKTVESAYSTYLLLNISVFPILTICVLVMEISGDKHYEQVSVVMCYICAFFPQFSLTYMASKFSRKFVQNNNWDVKSEKEKRLMCSYDSLPCCAPESDQCKDHRSYFTDLDFVYVTLVTTCLSLLLLMWFDTFRFLSKSIVLRLPHRKDRTTATKQSNNEQLQKVVSHDEKQTKILDVKSIMQKYLTYKSWPPWKEIIKGISFEVKKGECLGLLGVNGAGKSTTFRILAGEEKPAGGDVNTDDRSIYEFTGYCPQQDALIDELTGRELLTIFANLRGETSPEECVKLWFTAFNMLEYADLPCGTYSGGNKRKLNTCLSLIGVPPLVILDEPTSGVDPKSRRIVWNVLSQIKKGQSSAIVLSSHSMDECEALCDRLIIITDGTIKEQGTISYLQEKEAGFSVKIKFKTDKDVIDYNTEHGTADKNQKGNSAAPSGNSSNVSEQLLPNKVTVQVGSGDQDATKQEVLKDLRSRIDFEKVDEHQGLLHIRVKNERWSGLFKHLEELKSTRSDIEDYTVSDSSLEDLFLNIAKENKREHHAKNNKKHGARKSQEREEMV